MQQQDENPRQTQATAGETRPIEFHYSKTKILGWLACTLVYTALIAAVIAPFILRIAANYWSQASVGLHQGQIAFLLILIVLLALVFMFFASCVLVLLRLLFDGRAVIGVEKLGLRDVRLGADLIPWPKIYGYSVVTVKKVPYLYLAADPGFIATYPFARPAFWFGSALQSKEFAPGANEEGCWISMRGLTGSVDDLVGAIKRYYPNLTQITAPAATTV